MTEEHSKNNASCDSPLHAEHLCYFVSQGFHLSDEQAYKSLVENPQFKCEHCGRVAGDENNLCKPVEL